MSESLRSWIMLALILFAANQAFFSERILGFLRFAHRKPFWAVLIEWAVGYILLALLFTSLEVHLYGKVFAQNGLFVATTIVLYAVLSFPGYAYRYLLADKPGTQKTAGSNEAR